MLLTHRPSLYWEKNEKRLSAFQYAGEVHERNVGLMRYKTEKL